MRSFLLVFLALSILSLALSSYYIFDLKKNEIDAVISQNVDWKIKEKEKRTRLHSVPILLYHNIDGKGVYSIELDTLRSHFQLLKDNNVKVIRLSDFVTKLTNPSPFNEKVIAITFDDGYLSMFTKLLPLSREFGYPITLFIYTNMIYTKSKNNMTWKRLRELEDNGIEIECHSISHADLEVLSKEQKPASKRKLFEEIYLSKRIIELYLNKKITYFAFPYGRYDLKLIELCKYAGYERVFSTDYGSNIVTRNNYCLRRGHIKSNHSLKFIERKISYGY